MLLRCHLQYKYIKRTGILWRLIILLDKVITPSHQYLLWQRDNIPLLLFLCFTHISLPLLPLLLYCSVNADTRRIVYCTHCIIKEKCHPAKNQTQTNHHIITDVIAIMVYFYKINVQSSSTFHNAHKNILLQFAILE